MHQDHELHGVIAPVFPFIPPPLYLEVKKVKAYIIRNANRQILRGKGRETGISTLLLYIFSNLFPPDTFNVKLDEPKMTFIFCS